MWKRNKESGEGGEDEKYAVIALGVEDNSVKNKEATPSTTTERMSQKISSSDDSNHLTTMFPEEIWEMILNLVGDSKSVHNTFLAYPAFGNIFENKTTLWFFDQIIPHLVHYLTKNDVRRCAHVCKTWRHVIFKYAEDHPLRRPYNKDTNPVLKPLYPSRSHILVDHFDNDFGTIDSIKRFLEIQPNHSNPFIGRSVELNHGVIRFQNFPELKHYTTLLLQEYGKHIWYFKIISYSLFESCSDFHEWLAVNLSYLPNLRSLTVEPVHDQDEEEEENNDAINLRPIRRPFPSLCNLESLTLVERGTDLDILVALIRSYGNSQLQYISLPAKCWTDELNQDYRLIGLTELQIVSTDIESSRNVLSSLSKENLQRIEFAGDSCFCPEEFLKKICGFQVCVLDFSGTSVMSGQYFHQCKSAGCCQTRSSEPVMFPSIHTLRMELNLVSIDKFNILRRFPLLQTLEVIINLDYVNSLDEWLEDQRGIMGHLDKLKRSRVPHGRITEELNKWIYRDLTVDRCLVWNLLPGLKSLKVSIVYRVDRFYRTNVCTYQRKEFV